MAPGGKGINVASRQRAPEGSSDSFVIYYKGRRDGQYTVNQHAAT